MSTAEFSILVGKVWSSLSEYLIKKSFQVTDLYNESMPNESPINRKAFKTSNFVSIDAISDQSRYKESQQQEKINETSATEPARASTSTDTTESNKQSEERNVFFFKNSC